MAPSLVRYIQDKRRNCGLISMLVHIHKPVRIWFYKSENSEINKEGKN
ncbi:MAG: hypothetical protein K0R47_82 [Brevibacillus sp.]|nr:hypothetical protein [Brevibacillus sp.]